MGLSIDALDMLARCCFVMQDSGVRPGTDNSLHGEYTVNIQMRAALERVCSRRGFSWILANVDPTPVVFRRLAAHLPNISLGTLQCQSGYPKS